MSVLKFGPSDSPSSIKFDRDNRLVLWELVGRNRISGVMEQLAELVGHLEFERGHGILVDASQATFEGLRPNHMVAIFDTTRAHRGGRRAIVLGDTSLRKLADFFMLVRGDDGNVRFFKTRDKALDWLEDGLAGAAG